MIFDFFRIIYVLALVLNFKILVYTENFNFYYTQQKSRKTVKFSTTNICLHENNHSRVSSLNGLLRRYSIGNVYTKQSVEVQSIVLYNTLYCTKYKVLYFVQYKVTGQYYL